jgi:hypothetical protein
MTQIKQLKVGRAKTISGSIFRIKDAREYAASRSKRPDIVCWHCGKPVSYRAPKTAIDHFFHLSSEDGSPACANESELHAAFKLAICEELNEVGLDHKLVRGFSDKFEIMLGRAKTEVSVLDDKYRIDVVFKSDDGDLFAIEVVKSNPLSRAKRDEIITKLDMTMLVFRLNAVNENQFQEFMDIINQADQVAWARNMICSIGFTVEGKSRPKKVGKPAAEVDENHFKCDAIDAEPKHILYQHEPKIAAVQLKPTLMQATNVVQLYPGEHWCEKCEVTGIKKWASFGKKNATRIVWSCLEHR